MSLASYKETSFVYFLRDIKISHSIFALPFVFSTLVFLDFKWELSKLIHIVLCMICARSFAMGMNRFLDYNHDALNPRTKSRMIPSGKLAAHKGLLWSLSFGVGFIWQSFQLNFLAGLLSPLVLLILGFYPKMKTLSWGTHWYLGFCLGMSPMGADVALRGKIHLETLFLALAITAWTAGFDILYALQDYFFDKNIGIKSVPTRFGVKTSLNISRFCFLIMVVFLFCIGLIKGKSVIYFVGVFFISLILIIEQWLVKDSDEEAISKNINLAFFNLNACVGLFYLTFTILDHYFKL